MSLYIGITRLSFGRNNVLTVVCKILKIIQNEFKLLWQKRASIFLNNVGINI
jgi:hypothetical protein